METAIFVFKKCDSISFLFWRRRNYRDRLDTVVNSVFIFCENSRALYIYDLLETK